MVDEHESGTLGVPQDMVPAIAAAVLDTLADLDIDPGNVYLSGHDGRESDPDAAKLQDCKDIHTYDEYVFPDETGAPEDDPNFDYAEITDVRQQQETAAREEEMLKFLDDKPKPVYSMSHAFTLHDPVEKGTNPIHFAGISPKSTIVVYDKTLIDRWDPDLPGEIAIYGPSICATEAELAVTVLARIRLRYRIEDEEDESPPPIPNN